MLLVHDVLRVPLDLDIVSTTNLAISLVKVNGYLLHAYSSFCENL